MTDATKGCNGGVGHGVHGTASERCEMAQQFEAAEVGQELHVEYEGE